MQSSNNLLPFVAPLPCGVREAEVKHPSRGGNPYDQEVRRMVISLWFCRGIEYIRSASILAQLR